MTSGESGDRLAEELAGVAREGGNLFREEAERAREEEKEKMVPIAGSTVLIVGGGILSGLGSVFLVQAGVRLLATKMPLWLAAFLTGGTLTLGGMTLAAIGARTLKDTELLPSRTIDRFTRTGESILRQARSNLR